METLEACCLLCRKGGRMNNKIMKKRRTLAAVLVISLLCMTGCGAANGTPDDVATNDGGSQTESETGSGGISKDLCKNNQ